ncbi:MAG: membrane protein insertase YidC [Gammaproteobacteria bacterium]|nr:membrane protein insertase YidC [Gammaproteobacteria bacterium]MDH5241439.1 membrane protein insertase YidC [Gammaproteobacteria bacterium]MDH5262471.1 membrane protein insertase YidC [Gammaproteobacteria bacterium]MDH5584550.1 membrane protein insertase YidC [Gammaproteobacteria bacterium]
MENQRLLIWGLFGLLAWITYQTWVQDYAPKPVAIPTQPQEQAEFVSPDDGGELPELSAPADGGQDDLLPLGPDEEPAKERVAATIRVVTDVLDIEISTEGGTLQSATLLGYPVAKDDPNTLVQLLSTEPANLGLIRTGLRTTSEGNRPDYRKPFTPAATSYELGNDDELVVSMSRQSDDGATIEKRYRFTRGSYAIAVEHEVTNNGEALWRGAPYAQIVRVSREPERSMFDVDSYSFAGPIIYTGEKAEKLQRDDLLEDGPYDFKSQTGWVGAIQHHFLSAVVPTRGVDKSFRVSVKGDRTTASISGLAESVASGSSKIFASTVFVGPKLQSQLEEIDKTLALTVDYGWLTIISNPLFLLLSFIYDYVHNWGVAIILVTFLIKLVFYKLTESSGRSMAKMRNLQPRMKALQERYKDDKPALSAQMMDLYKREKVNPAAGCLPILIQMPFFLAFYWVLLESVEMRQAPFALWITDLSSKDPYFILPLIMGAAMLVQQKLNPAPADPVQAKVMQIMPIMFTVFFAFFPSGLVLYWVTNTLLSIAQQWKINKVVEREAREKKH